MDTARTGTRCAVCTHCGRCFESDDKEGSTSWSGERCEVCVSCGKCAQAWGLIPADGEVDATSGATSWADAFKVMDTGAGPPPPALSSPPGCVADAAKTQHDDEVDAVTGATPGVASACRELGLDDMASVAAACGIKPPGEK